MAGAPSAIPSIAPATVPDMVTSSAAFSPRLTPESTRSGLAPSTRYWMPSMTQSVGVSRPQGFGQGERTRGARLFDLGGAHPDVIGERGGDRLQRRQALSVNAVVI